MEGVEEILNLQPKGANAKPYQVKQVTSRPDGPPSGCDVLDAPASVPVPRPAALRRDAASWTLRRPSWLSPLCPRRRDAGASKTWHPHAGAWGPGWKAMCLVQRMGQPRMGRRNKAHGDALRAVGSGRSAEPTPAVSSAPYGAMEPCFGEFTPRGAFRRPVRGWQQGRCGMGCAAWVPRLPKHRRGL